MVRQTLLTIEDFRALTIENIIRANDGKLMTAYEHSTIQLQIMCKVGHVFYISSKKVKKGDWCEECCKDENEPS